MPINEMQKRVREIGRIRLGEQRVAKSGKSYPASLDHFRLTSQNKHALDMAAELYGGEVERWEEKLQWELTITADELPIIVSPLVPVSQWFEDWTGAICQHRCDGDYDQITDSQCSCDPDKRVCKPTTRFSVILPELPDLGVWRMETKGWNAAMELEPTAQILLDQVKQGNHVIAYLAIEKRSKKVDVGGKTETRNFIVPVIRIHQSMAEVMGIGARAESQQVVSGRSVNQITGEITEPVRAIEPVREVAKPHTNGSSNGSNGSTEKPAQYSARPKTQLERQVANNAKAASAYAPTRIVNDGPDQCEHCHAPSGKAHGNNCQVYLTQSSAPVEVSSPAESSDVPPADVELTVL